MAIHQFFVLLLFTLISRDPQLAMSKSPHLDNSTDLQSLLAFKAALTDPDGLLATNWTANTSFCNWAGVYCSSPKRRPPRVVALLLENVFLRGTISPHVGNLSFLSKLHLGTNNLTGTIPDAIARLPRLSELKLLQNSLSGEIPPGIFNMSSLTKLSVTYNNLSGPLPSTINLPRLGLISLSKNQLTGPIPSSFGHCSNLQVISISYNEFSGTIPAELGNITALSTLYIGGNKLTGTIPTSIGNLTNLSVLDLSNAYLEGGIPEEFGNLLNLQKLNLGYNSLTGAIPLGLLNATELYFIQLFQNNLTGPIPSSIGEAWPQLTTMNFAFNQFTGGLDFVTSLTNCKNLNYIVAAGNPIQGVLPDSVGNLTAELRYFLMDGSLIHGRIPVGFGNLSNLQVIDLAANQLTGELPSDFWRLKQLGGIYLDRNRISGTIPSDFGKMAGLNVVMLEKNVLSGSIPDSVGNITGLQHLFLAGNRLSSSIPGSIWRLKGVIDISLSRNTLDGTLAMMKVGDLEALDTLDLSMNRLSGDISTALGSLKMLEQLDLSDNSFHNQIPESLGALTNIKYLNLSHNMLTGAIPKSFASLPLLDSLDLSFNELEGEVPKGRVFSNSSIPSLKGNADLCGAPQLGFETNCSSIATPSNSKNRSYLLKYILPPIAFVVVLVSCLYLLLVHHRRRINAKDKTLSEDPSPSNLRSISYYELVRATDNFSDANLLGKGGFSSVFKGCLDDGLVVAAKVLNLEVQGALKSFDAECGALGMLRHRNLVKVISACSNLDFKALVLEFMPNGNLEQWLHSSDRYLNLHQRLDIMVDVSRAIEYLHHDHPDVVLHCDLKPSNVLLDGDMVARVGDFGIAKLLLGDDMSALSASAPGTIGYIAPEYGLTGKISRKGDVYSFGIMLLETFTRRRPSDAAFDGGLNFRQWVSEAYDPDGMLEIVDDSLVREEEAIMTQRRRQPEVIHQCLSSVIELGLMCSRKSPKERISMRDVVPTLQKIRGEYVSKELGA